MPIGTLKYKQDDGSIVELYPAGYVKTETYTAGQAEQNNSIAAAQTAADKANTNIGNWETDHPGQTISECATSIENEVAAVDAKADAADTKATNNANIIGDWTAAVNIATKDDQQDRRLTALETAHHYATIEEAIKNKGYLDVKDVSAPFTFQQQTASTTATAKYGSYAQFRIQLPPDTVIDDVSTQPTGKVNVTPAFGYISSENKYTVSATSYSWPILNASYLPVLHTVLLVLEPKDAILINAKDGATPLFWTYEVEYR